MPCFRKTNCFRMKQVRSTNVWKNINWSFNYFFSFRFCLTLFWLECHFLFKKMRLSFGCEYLFCWFWFCCLSCIVVLIMAYLIGPLMWRFFNGLSYLSWNIFIHTPFFNNLYAMFRQLTQNVNGRGRKIMYKISFLINFFIKIERSFRTSKCIQSQKKHCLELLNWQKVKWSLKQNIGL